MFLITKNCFFKSLSLGDIYFLVSLNKRSCSKSTSKVLWVLCVIFPPFPFHHTWKLIFWIFCALCVEIYSCAEFLEVRKADLISEHCWTSCVIISTAQGCRPRRLQEKYRIKFMLPTTYNPVKQKECCSLLKFSLKVWEDRHKNMKRFRVQRVCWYTAVL